METTRDPDPGSCYIDAQSCLKGSETAAVYADACGRHIAVGVVASRSGKDGRRPVDELRIRVIADRDVTFESCADIRRPGRDAEIPIAERARRSEEIEAARDVGDDVDDTAARVASVQRRSPALDDLDPLDPDRGELIDQYRPGRRIGNRHPVDEDERLRRERPPDPVIDLCSERTVVEELDARDTDQRVGD